MARRAGRWLPGTAALLLLSLAGCDILRTPVFVAEGHRYATRDGALDARAAFQRHDLRIYLELRQGDDYYAPGLTLDEARVLAQGSGFIQIRRTSRWYGTTASNYYVHASHYMDAYNRELKRLVLSGRHPRRN